MALRLRGTGISDDAISEAVRAENRMRCVPPLPDGEVEHLLASARRYEPLDPVFARNDIGNRERFVRQHGEDLCYDAAGRKWYEWSGNQWVGSDAGIAMERAMQTALSIHDEAAIVEQRLASIQDADARKHAENQSEELHKWAHRSAARSRIEATVRLAQSHHAIAVAPDELDRDPWLLGAPNAVIEMRTGDARPPKRSDLITKLTGARFDPRAKYPRWEAFLNDVFLSDRKTIDFIQRWFGYAATGSTIEQVLLFFYGYGRNGKSTAAGAIKHVFGDYAQGMTSDTVMAKKGDSGIPNDVARLKGARLVFVPEVDNGRRLNEVLVKSMTGGDVLTARFLHGEFFDFYATHKMVMFGNSKPRVVGTDEGIWRRLILVPFLADFKGREDKNLLDILKEESSGILNWIIAGCLSWQQIGLQPPDSITNASQEYREAQDTVGQFLADCCERGDNKRISSSKFLESYQFWCEENGFESMNRIRVREYMENHGFTYQRKASGMELIGIAVKTPAHTTS
jgi:putative DNA primase/helicase